MATHRGFLAARPGCSPVSPEIQLSRGRIPSEISCDVPDSTGQSRLSELGEESMLGPFLVTRSVELVGFT